MRMLVIDRDRKDKESVLLSVGGLDKNRKSKQRVLYIVHKRIADIAKG